MCEGRPGWTEQDTQNIQGMSLSSINRYRREEKPGIDAARVRTQQSQVAANETTRQAATQQALQAQRQQVQAQISESAAAAPTAGSEEVDVNLAGADATTSRKRQRFQTAASSSIRI